MWEFLVFIALLSLGVEAVRRRRRQADQDDRLSKLVSRLEHLEQEIHRLRAELSAGVVHSKVPEEPAEVAPKLLEVRGPVPVPAVPAAPLPAPPVHPAIPPPAPARAVATSAPPKPAAPPPVATPARGQIPFASRARKMLDLEETLGANWLNKLGVISLVIGISLYLAYKLGEVGPLGKVLAGYAVSIALLGAGIFFERSARYRVIARAAIGGGWALLFFTTYAMHHVPAARVIESQALDLMLLLLVATAMVVHTLRYDSQVVTGMAFLLAFTTVTISHNTVYSLSAGAILAAGLAAIACRRGWFELEIFGILASYLNHYSWLRTIIEPMGSAKQMFPEFTASALLLVFYWAVFRWSYIARRIERVSQERISTLAAILNTSLLLGLMKYQSVRSGLAFFVLLALGAIEITLAQLPITRRRRDAFVILSTIGATLLVAAIPFRYSSMELSVLWLAEAEALLLAGVFTREILFRRFGILAAALGSGYMLGIEASRVSGERLATAVDAPGFAPALAFAFAAAVFYANAHYVARRWNELMDTEFERRCFRAFSYVAGLMAFVAAWLAFPGVWTAVAWAALGLMAAFSGRRLLLTDVALQAHFFSALALVRVLVANLDATQEHWGVTLRALTLGMVAFALYLCARWSGAEEAGQRWPISEAYTSCASALIAILIYYELPDVWVAIGWMTFVLALSLIGRRLDRRDLSFQAHALSIVALFRLLAVNSATEAKWGAISARLVTLGSAAALYYVTAGFAGPRKSRYVRYFSAGYTWAGTLLVALLGYFEMASPWVAVAWAALALLLVGLGSKLSRRSLAVQGHVLAAAAVARALVTNLDVTELYAGVTLRLITVSCVAMLLYVASRWAARNPLEHSRHIGMGYTWAGSLLVSVLMWYELQPISVALAWALFGLLLFELGVSRGSGSLRLQAYVATLSSFARIFFVNLNAEAPAGELSPRLYTMLPLAVIFYYFYARLLKPAAGTLERDSRWRAAEVHSYLGSITLAALLRFELPLDWVVAGWAGLILLLVGYTWKSGQNVFLQQAYLLSFAVLFRTVLHNFFQRAHAAESLWDSRVAAVGLMAALLFATLAFAFPLRERLKEWQPGRRFARFAGLLLRPEQVFFFLPLGLITALLGLEVRKGLLTVSWGVEAVLVFLFALWVGERNFRLTGLALLLLCVGKIGLVDVWGLGPADKYLTLICLGAALLLVSFLYTRYREAIRQYL